MRVHVDRGHEARLPRVRVDPPVCQGQTPHRAALYAVHERGHRTPYANDWLHARIVETQETFLNRCPCLQLLLHHLPLPSCFFSCSCCSPSPHPSTIRSLPSPWQYSNSSSSCVIDTVSDVPCGMGHPATRTGGHAPLCSSDRQALRTSQALPCPTYRLLGDDECGEPQRLSLLHPRQHPASLDTTRALPHAHVYELVDHIDTSSSCIR